MKHCPDCGYTGDDKEFEMTIDSYMESLFDNAEELFWTSSDLPCYLSMVTGVENIDLDTYPIHEVLEYLVDNSNGMLLVSVTSLEKDYKQWLEAVEMYPGANVTSYDRGSRIVYLISIPVIPNL